MKSILFVVLMWAIIVAGYVMNIVKLVGCDFKAPYKAEVIRSIGVFVPPVGVVVGYFTINDK